MIQHRHVLKNELGTDYFVGDIHGEYDELIYQLHRAGFDNRCDRLFAVGDLIDRGPKSHDCLLLLNEPWFFSVLGNHEKMMLERAYSSESSSIYFRNGGRWIVKRSETDLKMYLMLVNQKMPLSMTINTPEGKVGICHASAPADWNDFLTSSLKPEEEEEVLFSDEQYQKAITKRSRAILNIDLVVHGHVNTPYLEIANNQVWIDTLLQSGRLTIMSSGELFSLLE